MLQLEYGTLGYAENFVTMLPRVFPIKSNLLYFLKEFPVNAFIEDYYFAILDLYLQPSGCEGSAVYNFSGVLSDVYEAARYAETHILEQYSL